MRAEQVDPRASRWERDRATYRIDFWSARAGDWASDEWLIRDADVDEVLAWAEAKADGRYVVLWAQIEDAGGAGLVRLRG